MRKLTVLLTICMLLGLTVTVHGKDDPKVILYTVYEQMGWGDRVEVGCVDEEGGLWTMSGSASEIGWPYKTEEQPAYLAEHKIRLVSAGRIEDFDDLFDLRGMVNSVEEDTEAKSVPAANDAGTELSFAVRYDKDGTAHLIKLGTSGDDVFENTDPTAQALYLYLRQQFPGVTCYPAADGMGPAGFTPVPLAEFCGIDLQAAQNARIEACYNDCEAGPSPVDPGDILETLKNGIVTGKASCTMTTGDFYTFSFYNENDEHMFSVDLYRGLLVRNDGMYYIEMPSE